MDEQKKLVLDFLKTQNLGVFSTVDSKNNKPESALVAFAETENLEIIVGTSDEYRKFQNVKTNPSVSLVFGFEYISVQYEGTAKIAEGDEIKEYEKILVAKNPKSSEYASDPHERYIKISPRWLRYVDLNKTFGDKPLFEINF